MRISMDIIGDSLVVVLEGELDHHTSEYARKRIDREYYNNNLLNMVLDLGKLSFMDSSGVGLIMGRYKTCSEGQGRVSIVSSNSNINRILKMSGLLKLIDIYPNMDEAIRGQEG